MTSPRFLYLHGFASSRGSTKALAFLAWAERQGLEMIALDLRVPTFETLSFAAITRTVTKAIDEAGGPSARVALVGSSLGGLAATRVAASDPRVCSVFAMAPAFALAKRWRERLGEAAFDGWRTEGSLEVDDWASPSGLGARARVHFDFVAELERIDAELGPFPDVRVPVRIVHGVHDDIVDIELSRAWARDKRHVKLVEVDDGHPLTASLPRVLEEASDFFRPFTGA